MCIRDSRFSGAIEIHLSITIHPSVYSADYEVYDIDGFTFKRRKISKETVPESAPPCDHSPPHVSVGDASVSVVAEGETAMTRSGTADLGPADSHEAIAAVTHTAVDVLQKHYSTEPIASIAFSVVKSWLHQLPGALLAGTAPHGTANCSQSVP